MSNSCSYDGSPILAVIWFNRDHFEAIVIELL